jgi:hypothetical protein
MSLDPSVRRTRSALSLGAAFAIFGSVMLGYDAPESQAAGGFFEALFGFGREADTVHDGYSAYRARISRAPRRFRLAHHPRRHDIQARRRVAERRKAPAHSLTLAASAQKQTFGPAVIEMIAPSRNPFVQVIGAAGAAAPAARMPATEPAVLPHACGKSCIAAPVSGAAPPAAAPPLSNPYADPTLRPGDGVVTTDGVRILRRGSRFPFKATDFVSLDDAGGAHLANRSALHEIDRALKTPPGRVPTDL